MADYIEREGLTKELTRIAMDPCSELEAAEVFAVVANQPAADVAPVRRGHWVKVGTGTTCSECMQGLLRVDGKQSKWVDLSGVPYCPSCGAKMEAEHDKRGSD